MKTLQDVAKSFRKAAGKAIYPGVPYSGYKTGTSKAFRTGNLLAKFVSSPNNAPNQIVRENKITKLIKAEKKDVYGFTDIDIEYRNGYHDGLDKALEIIATNL